MMPAHSAVSLTRPALIVSHAADYLRRYPGERVTFYTRAEVGPSFSSFRLQVIIPEGLKFEKYQTGQLPSLAEPLFSYANGSLFLIWDVEKDPDARVICDFEVTTAVNATRANQNLESLAELIAGPEQEKTRVDESVSVVIKAKGSYLKYLPSIYQDDDLMGRLLMLFESFITPLEQRIDHMPDYLDARTTPAELMPWLASWTGLVLDSDLSETQRRKLLWNAGSLFLRRGTRAEMQEYLEIITNGKVEVIDSPGFRLGPQTFLGLGTSLGEGNLPYMFSVKVSVPAPAKDMSEEERARYLKTLESKIRTVIGIEKPAHTGYTFSITVEDMSQ